MPIEIPGTQFTFVFDSHGRLRLPDNAKSLKFLEMVEKNPELVLILGPEPLPPNATIECIDKPPAPNRTAGCTNTLCPMKIGLKLEPLVQEERTRILEQFPDRDG